MLITILPTKIKSCLTVKVIKADFTKNEIGIKVGKL